MKGHVEASIGIIVTFVAELCYPCGYRSLTNVMPSGNSYQGGIAEEDIGIY